MGVYIKGMEMPTSCMTCLLQTPYMGGWCFLLNDNSNAYSRRRDCLIAPVPKHGRLIDADEFLHRAIGTKCFDEDYVRMLQELIGESTTIIPAEESET